MQSLVKLSVLFMFLTNVSSYICNINSTALASVAAELETKGYIVEKGWLVWHQHPASSYGNNPNLSYGFTSFARDFEEGTQILKHFESTLNESQMLYYTKSGLKERHHQSKDQMWTQYGTNGFLWHGCLPPSAYFSVRTYINRRYNPPNWNGELPMIDPYGSLGDTINQEILNYSIPSNSNFYNITTLISSSDLITYNDIYNSLINHFGQSAIAQTINFDQIPFQYNLSDGYTQTIYWKELDYIKQLEEGKPLDELNMMFRSGLPYLTDSKMAQYFTENQTFYKLYLDPNKHNNDTSSRHPVPPFLFNTSNINATTNEIELLQPYFLDYIQTVIDYVQSNYSDLQYWYSTPASQVYKGQMGYGFNCIRYGTRCEADNRDSQYTFTYPQVFKLLNNSLQFVVGVIHKDLNNCQWENIVPYYEDRGTYNIISRGKSYQSNYTALMSTKYRNSTLIFPPRYITKDIIPDDNILNKMFVIPVMRDVVSKQYPFFKDNLNGNLIMDYEKLPIHNNWFPIHRCYINPILKTKSNYNHFLPMKVLTFRQYPN